MFVGGAFPLAHPMISVNVRGKSTGSNPAVQFNMLTVPLEFPKSSDSSAKIRIIAGYKS